jgi:hypothetical protein
MLFNGSVYRIDISNISSNCKRFYSKNAFMATLLFHLLFEPLKLHTPSLANAKVIAFPIPFPAPVIKAFLFF